PGRRLQLSGRRHARPPAPATTQPPQKRVGHRPPRTHRRCPRGGVSRATQFRTRVSHLVLDGSAKDVPCLSQFAGDSPAFTGLPRPNPTTPLKESSPSV